jgi:hypothetical protein
MVGFSENGHMSLRFLQIKHVSVDTDITFLGIIRRPGFI